MARRVLRVSFPRRSWRYGGEGEEKSLDPSTGTIFGSLNTRQRKPYEIPQISAYVPTAEDVRPNPPVPVALYGLPQVPKISQAVPLHRNENPFIATPDYVGPFDCTVLADHDADPRLFHRAENISTTYQEGHDLHHRMWGDESACVRILHPPRREERANKAAVRVPTTTPETVVVFGGDTHLGIETVAQLTRKDQIKELRVGVHDPATYQQLIDRSTILPNKDKIKVFYAWQLDRMTIEPELVGADVAVNLFDQAYECELTHHSAHVAGAEHVSFGCLSQQVPRHIIVTTLPTNHINAVDSPSAYLRTKALSEDISRANFRGTTAIRPGPMFSDSSPLIRALLKTPAYIAHSPRSLIQPVYVGDVAAAVTAAVLDNSTVGNVYELGGPDVFEHRDLAKWLLRHYGRKRPIIHGPTDYFVRTLGSFYSGLRSFFPNPVATPDLVEILYSTHVLVRPDAGSFTELGVTPRRLEDVLNANQPYGF